MAEQYTPNIGHLCHEFARRDAIHFAVAPVVAAHDLWPGDGVGVQMDGTAGSFTDVENVGIADPFYGQQIKKGERFWLILFPGTITGLRHVWSHPAFRPKVPGVEQ